MENTDRDLRERVGMGMSLWVRVRVWGKRGKRVLQALWIHPSGNDLTSNNPSTKLSTPSKAIPIPTPVHIHLRMRGDSLLPPKPASLPFSEYTFYPINADSTPDDDIAPRRPSLPHIYNDFSPSFVIPHLPHADPAQQAKTQMALLKRRHQRGNQHRSIRY